MEHEFLVEVKGEVEPDALEADSLRAQGRAHWTCRR